MVQFPSWGTWEGGGVVCFASEYSEIDFLELGGCGKGCVGGATQPCFWFDEFWLRG